MNTDNSTDKITILRARGNLVLAKTWQPDGTILDYASAKNYEHRQETVSGIEELAALLTRQAGRPQECVIRGGYIGDEFAIPAMQTDPSWAPGFVLRQKEVFRDRALHSVMIDVDKFEPEENPLSIDAIDEFIEKHLPPVFHGRTYFWQLSSSAGRSNLLKAHLWFWLETPYTSAQLTAWAKHANLTMVDVALFREMQPHYTSNPVMGYGVVDPLAGRRCGISRHPYASVPLQLDPDLTRKVAPPPQAVEDDPIAQVLHERGMVTGERRLGGLFVECPRQDKHTDGTTGSSSCIYFAAGTNGFTHGNFKCLHASCEGVHQNEFRAALGVPAMTRGMDPSVFGSGETTVPAPAHTPPRTEMASTPKGEEKDRNETFISPPAQIDFFAGCVYVVDQHKVLVPGGYLLKPEQFKVQYGGHVFNMDMHNEKVTKDAWECFTLSPVVRFPRADSSCFRPTLPATAIIKEAGRTLVNTWWPVEVPRKQGDATPFLEHLRKLLPDERDRMILLCYMAACVQHQGVKFQWAPVVQGVEGNGKTLFTRCVAEAVGKRYVHLPKASKLANQFNGWMVGKVFYGVEDIYTPNNKAEVIEELKPMITGESLEIEGKGIDQISVDIVGNFLFNSNHKDAVKKTRNDRRFAPLFTAQQEVEDLRRDGMAPEGPYFRKLYDWLKLQDGYAIVSDLLHTYPIPDEFNPATGCQRAPRTTSTEAAISATIGSIEQEVIEAIEQGRPGFSGGWISSMMLDRFLQERHMRLSSHKRHDLLVSLGYVKHPALPDGRALKTIAAPDNGKPRIYIKSDSDYINIKSGPEAIHKYETDQLPFGAPGLITPGVG